MGLGIDLNEPIPQNCFDEGTSSRPPGSYEFQVVQHGEPPQLTLIDVDSIDDDVVVSSASSFAKAKSNSRRNRGRNIIDIDSEESTRRGAKSCYKRQSVPPNLLIINCETYSSFTNGSSMTLPPPPPPPQKEPTISCPICMGPLVEEMSTKCGHIFCKACITAAITAHKSCPACRRRATMKDIIRVYLPTTN
ncbi:hypothetical protein Dimus_016994 [Dionaea muscipula]